MSSSLAHLDPPLIKPEISLGDVTRDVIAPTKKLYTKLWLACLLISSSALCVGVYVVYNELKIGLGLFGWNHPACRHFNLRHSISFTPALADFH